MDIYFIFLVGNKLLFSSFNRLIMYIINSGLVTILYSHIINYYLCVAYFKHGILSYLAKLFRSRMIYLVASSNGPILWFGDIFCSQMSKRQIIAYKITTRAYCIIIRLH